MKISYLGPDGSYSYFAAKAYCKEKNLAEAEMLPEKTFAKVVRNVETGKADVGILPLENSTEGIVTQVVDLLYYSDGTCIIGEVVLPIRHGLFNKSGKLEDIKYVYSNFQPLEQCRTKLAELIEEGVLTECGSSTQACEIAREKSAEYGAVASIEAGHMFGLKLVAEDIQDNGKNATRFIALACKCSGKNTGRDKTSIAFTFREDKPGSLYQVLREFANSSINLGRIESRPMKEELGKYVFYIDFEGHMEDPGIPELLDRVKVHVDTMKILGSYKMAESCY